MSIVEPIMESLQTDIKLRQLNPPEFIDRYLEFHKDSIMLLNDLLAKLKMVDERPIVKFKKGLGKAVGITSDVEEEKNETNFTNNEIVNIMQINYLTPYGRAIIPKVTFGTIDLYNKQGKLRNSGSPYAVHPLSVGHILAELSFPYYVLAAGINHDNIEERAKNKQIDQGIKPDDIPSLELLTNELFEHQFLASKETAKRSKARVTRVTDSTSTLDKTELRELVYSSIILQKVTRIESDENYYQSIERIFDRNITENTFGLKSIFEGYKYETGEELVLSDNEITDIVEASACVKLSDRMSNTLDTYEEQTFTKRMKDVYKSAYVINRVTEYLNSHKDDSSAVKRENYQKMKYLRSVLIEANKRIIAKGMDNVNSEMKAKGEYDESFEEYKSKSGFSSIDYGFDDNVYSGTIRGMWNEIVNNNEAVIEDVNKTMLQQYKALTVFEEINNSFMANDNFSLSGFGKLGIEQKLGYYDDMGQKGSDEWKAKKEHREKMGVDSFHSYYEVTGEKVTYERPMNKVL